MIKVKKFTGRKSKKATVNTGVVHIKSTFNNTIVNIIIDDSCLSILPIFHPSKDNRIC